MNKASVFSSRKFGVGEMLPHFQKLIADLTGRKIGINITTTQVKQIDQRVMALLTSFTEFSNKVSSTSDENEKKRYLNEFLKVCAEFFFEIHSTENYLDLVIK